MASKPDYSKLYADRRAALSKGQAAEFYKSLDEGRRQAFSLKGEPTNDALMAALASFKPAPQKKSGGNPVTHALGAVAHGGKDVLSRTIDLLSRGTYASASAFYDASNPNDGKGWDVGAGFKGFGKGLAGKEKHTFADVFAEHGVNNPVVKYGAGFAADVLGDPTTYLPGIGLMNVYRRGAQGVEKGAAAAVGAARDAGTAQVGVRTVKSGDRKLVVDRAGQTVSRRPEQSPSHIPGMVDNTGATVVNPGAAVVPYKAPAEVVHVGPHAPVESPAVEHVIQKLAEKKVDVTPPTVANQTVYKSPHFTRDGAGKIVLTPKGQAEVEKRAKAALAGKGQANIDIEKLAEADFKAMQADGSIDKALTWKDVKKDPEAYMYHHSRAVEASQKVTGADPAAALKAAKHEAGQKLYAEEVAKVKASKEVAPAAKVEAAVAKIAAPKAAVGMTEKDFATHVAPEIERYTKLVSENKPVNVGKPRPRAPFNPAKQRNMAQAIRQRFLAARGGKAKVGMSTTIRANIIEGVRKAEDAVTAATGHAPTDYAGNAFRISDVLKGLKPGTLVTDKLLAEIEVAARSASGFAGASEEVKAAVTAAKKVAGADEVAAASETALKTESMVEALATTGTEAEKVAAKTELPKAAVNEAKANGLAPATQDAVKSAAVDALKGLEIDPLARNFQAALTITSKAVLAEKVPAEAVAEAVHQYQIIDKALGTKGWNAAKPMVNLSQSVKAQDLIAKSFPQAFAKKFIAGFQMSKIYPTMRMGEASAENFAYFRANTIRHLFSGELENVDRQMTAWKNMHPDRIAMDPEAQKIADHLNKWVAAKDSFLRSNGLSLEELNDALRRQQFGEYFKFERKFKDQLGVTHKLAKDEAPTGEFLMRQISTWDPAKLEKGTKSPVAALLYDLEASMEKAVALNDSLGHLAHTLGTTTKVNGWGMVPHPRLTNYRFPPEIHGQINKYLMMLDELGNPTSKLWRDYDKVLNLWKRSVTIYTPGFHIRNMMGDVFLTFLAGHSSIEYYIKAQQVLHARDAVREGAQFGEAGLAVSQVQSRAGAKTILRHSKLGPVTDEQLIHGFHKFGGSQIMAITDNLGQPLETSRAITRPFKGKVREKVGSASELREDYGRMAHFIGALKKSKQTDLDSAMREAMAEVRKYHFDYGDLTQFERNVMKRAIPFYTWLRKSTPLLLEKTAESPWKMAVVPKANFAIAGMLGQDPQSISQPFPTSSDSMFPSWMKESAGAQWIDGNTPWMGHIADPFSDLLANNVNHPVEGIGSALTPALKIPAELMTGTQMLGHIPIKDKTNYLDSQIPGASVIGRLTNTSPVTGLAESIVSNPDPGGGFLKKNGSGDKTAAGTGGMNSAALASFLSGLGFTEDTLARQKSAQFEQKAALAAQRKKAAK